MLIVREHTLFQAQLKEIPNRMMPIVDPFVQLTANRFELGDYLKQSSTFHVLRMVAVQQPLSAPIAAEQLHYLHKLSTTRGSGRLLFVAM